MAPELVVSKQKLRQALTRPFPIPRVSEQLAERLRTLVRDEKANILISGGTGAGKTSLLNALVAEIPPEERLGIIEDTREIIGPPP